MPEHEGTPALELWGGFECTVNRVGDRWRSQLERSGHVRRLSDLDAVAALGIRTLRYPLSWEVLAPERLDEIDWRAADERMARIRALGIRPIVGLVHHGSGPRYTRLDAPSFAPGLARLAFEVANRYPWVDSFTPVNEPLTTARFSGLYGHWFPHLTSASAFTRCLYNQCLATALAMRAIRSVRPDARLIQTDDLGRIHSTDRLRYQADFENERRWLSWDLLSGRVSREHPLYRHLLDSGLTEGELAVFLEQPCPPQVIGVNHYLTSDRFLDESLERYPAFTHGGNGIDRYADVEAVRVLPDCHGDIASAVREAWSRYRSPVAVTEAHLAGPREQQVRWLVETWQDARKLRGEGIDVRAVTAWSLLGAFDWNSLLTADADYYESGAFDVRSEPPRPTAIARAIQVIARGEEPNDPALTGPGWWRRSDRLFGSAPIAGEQAGPPILICGARGTLARALAMACKARGLAHRALSREQLDITDADSIERALDGHRPWAILNATGYVHVDAAENDHATVSAVNVRGPQLLARACARHGLPLLTFSSDLVFDGAKGAPYVESDPVAPLNAYGKSKADAESLVLDAHSGALVIRSAAFFGNWDRANFVERGLSALEQGRLWLAPEKLTVSPTYVLDLAHATLDLLVDRERGIWHITNRGALTWHDLAVRAATLAELPTHRIVASPRAAIGWSALRPPYSALQSERGAVMPGLDDALARFCAERRLRAA